MRSALRRRLSVWTWQDLLDEGISTRGIARRVASGELIRCGLGWYVQDGAPTDVVSALRRGRRLTCISSLRHHGLWVPVHPGVHDAGRRSSREGGSVTGERGSCRSTAWLRSWPDDEPILPVRESLRDAARCLDIEDLAVILESALNRHVVHPDDLDELQSTFPVMTRRGLRRLQSSAQSGTETRVRRHVEALGVTVRPQHRIDGLGIVDMLVGEVLIVECDSREHHTGETAYQEDRRRDLVAALLGYRVVRFTWGDVELRWQTTARHLSELVERGVHRGPSRGRRTGPSRVH